MSAIGKKVLVAILIVEAVVIAMIWSQVTQSRRTELSLESESASNKLADFFDRYGRMSEQMAVDPEIRELLKATGAGDQLNEMSGFDEVYRSMVDIAGIDSDNIMAAWIADIDANMITQSDGFTSGDGWEFSERAWSVCTETGEMVLTEPYVDSSTGKLILSAVSPVYDATGQILGAAGLDISLDHVNEMMQGYKIGNGGYIMLVSSGGTIIYDMDTERIQQSISEVNLSSNVVTAFENTEQSFLKYKSEGKTRYAYVGQVGETGYEVLSSMPFMEYYSDLLITLVVMLSIFGVGLVVIIESIKKTAAHLSKPIMQLNETAQKLADGQLDVTVDINSENEIGELAVSIRATVDRLKEYICYIDEIAEVLAGIADGDFRFTLKNEYIGEFLKLKDALLNFSSSMGTVMEGINQSADQVSAGADDLAHAAQDLAEGASTQAAAIEQLVATSDEVVVQVQESQKKFEDSVEETKKVTVIMEESQNQMNEMMAAMNKIQETSNQVVGIIQTIEEIADQTNLLSLNASIEAARAGEAGKGFAVVAGEIGKLAEESSKAANTTRELIHISMEEIGKGNELAVGVVDSLRDAVDAVERVNNVIKDAAGSATLQAQSMDQISIGIEEISKGVQDNSATAQESSATSEELAAQSATLNDMIQQFHF